LGEEFFTNADNNLIGGTTPGARNIISGNGRCGIEFPASASGNTVQGNFVGLAADGITVRSNASVGVLFGAFTTGTVIGGDDAADGTIDGIVNARNYISGNALGIAAGGPGFGGVTVQGNYIGTDTTGTLARGNTGGGIGVGVSSIVGGTTAGAAISSPATPLPASTSPTQAWCLLEATISERRRTASAR